MVSKSLGTLIRLSCQGEGSGCSFSSLASLLLANKSSIEVSLASGTTYLPFSLCPLNCQYRGKVGMFAERRLVCSHRLANGTSLLTQNSLSERTENGMRGAGALTILYSGTYARKKSHCCFRSNEEKPTAPWAALGRGQIPEKEIQGKAASSHMIFSLLRLGSCQGYGENQTSI